MQAPDMNKGVSVLTENAKDDPVIREGSTV